MKSPDMNIVIVGRLSDAGQNKESWGAMRKIQMEIVNEDPSGAWVDCDDLNDRMKDGKTQNAVHYERPEGYITRLVCTLWSGLCTCQGRKAR